VARAIVSEELFEKVAAVLGGRSANLKGRQWHLQATKSEIPLIRRAVPSSSHTSTPALLGRHWSGEGQGTRSGENSWMRSRLMSVS
jgi:hypothetical protein